VDKVLISERIKSWAETQIERAAVTVAAAILFHMQGIDSTSETVKVAAKIWKQTEREATDAQTQR